MERRRYKAVEHKAALDDRWDVVLTVRRDEPKTDGTMGAREAEFTEATCRGSGSKGGAHLIAKLLNDHEAVTSGDVSLALHNASAALETIQNRLNNRAASCAVERAIKAVEKALVLVPCGNCGATNRELHRKPSCVTA